MAYDEPPWEDADSDAAKIDALMTQHLSMMKRVIQRETRLHRYLNWSMVGFNVGLMCLNATFWWYEPHKWGYGIGLLVHAWTAGYFGWQLWRLWRRKEAV